MIEFKKLISHPEKLFSFFTFLVFASLSFANTYTVSNTDQEGAGSLRQAILDANANPGLDVIEFSVSGVMTSEYQLPPIEDNLLIDGTTAPGYVTGTPSFIIESNTLTVYENSMVNFLTIQGIELRGGMVLAVLSGAVMIQYCNIRGIICYGDASWTIAHNRWIPYSGGLELYNIPGGGLSVFDNDFGVDSDYGIYLENCANLVIGDVPGANISITPSENLHTNPMDPLKVVSCSNITFDHLDLSYPANLPPRGNGILTRYSSGDMTIKNCKLRNRGYAMYCNGDATWTVTDNDCRYSGSSINFIGVNSGAIVARNNRVAGSMQNFLTFYNCSNKTVGSSSVSPTPDIVFNLSDGLDSIGQSGILARYCSNLAFEDLSLNISLPGNIGYGINTENCQGTMSIINCEARNHGGGIGCDGDADWIVTGNDLSNCETALFFSNVRTGSIVAHDNILTTNSSTAYTALNLYRCSGVSVGGPDAMPPADIVIKDTEGLNTRPNTAIYAFQCDDLLFDGIDFTKTVGMRGGIGLDISGIETRATVRNCIFKNSEVGLSIFGMTDSSTVSCSIFENNRFGMWLTNSHLNNAVFDNVFYGNQTALGQYGSTAVNAQYNYWGGTSPQDGGFNGYSGDVDASNPLAGPAACTPFECADDDGDGVCNLTDNCPGTANADQADGDCDGVGNTCDICPGGDDTVDYNDDGIPDCSQLLGYGEYSPDWYCGSNKIMVCHGGSTLCINKNALAVHFNHGDKIGPCSDCNNTLQASAVDKSRHAEESADTPSNFEVFPNPAADELYLHLGEFTGTAWVNIYNELGALILTLQVAEGEHDLKLALPKNIFPNGIYVVQPAYGGRTESRRVVIER